MIWHDVCMPYQHFPIANDKDILIQFFESIRTKGKHFKYKNDF